jgi:ComF family protein
VFLRKITHGQTLSHAYDSQMSGFFERIDAVVQGALDTVMPRRPRRIRAESRTIESIEPSPMVHTMLGHEIMTIAPYTEIRDLIQSLKYDHSKQSARILATVLAEFLQDDIASRRQFSTHAIVLVPVPLDTVRYAERGHNHTALLLRALPREFTHGERALLDESLIARIRPTKQQTKLSRSDRLENVADAFALTDSTIDLSTTHIYLIDDVATTGATLVNAAKPLISAGVSVTLLALARA